MRQNKNKTTTRIKFKTREEKFNDEDTYDVLRRLEERKGGRESRYETLKDAVDDVTFDGSRCIENRRVTHSTLHRISKSRIAFLAYLNKTNRV